MNYFFNIVVLVVISIYLVTILYLLKKKKIYLKYALLWLLTGVFMIVLTIFPQLLQGLFSLCGFEVYSNGLFAVLCFFILLILLALTSIVSKLNDKSRRLIQVIALLEKRIRELERENETRE